MVKKNTERWVAEGWVHPRSGGDDYEFVREFKVKAINNDKKIAILLIKRTKSWLRKKSAIINDFIVYKNGSYKTPPKKVYPASKNGKFEF